MTLFVYDKPAIANMPIITSTGETGVLEDWRPPHKPSSTGKVYVNIKGCQREFYPSVIGGVFKNGTIEPKNY
jgi:hypothetical protein